MEAAPHIQPLWGRILFYLLCTHEYGHTIQCLVLGPLYWVVSALSSVIWRRCFAGYRKEYGVPYDALYCERTAWGKKWGRVQ